MNSKQREAVTTFGKDVCVSAGAGSGKTSVLVGRFAHAVTKLGDTPDRILALTFTEKAANHMKKQLIEKFTELGREDDRRALETAYIGTIHSFCARLLRENPIEAGVDPYFSVLSEGESDILMAKALDAAFEVGTDRPVWLGMLVDSEEKNLRAALLRLYAHFRATGEDDRLLRIESFTGERKDSEKKILSLLKEGVSLIGKIPSAVNEKAALLASQKIPILFSADEVSEDLFKEALSLLKIDKRGRKLKEWVEELSRVVSVWRSATLQELFAPKKEEFLRVFKIFKEIYEKEKRSRAVFDFDDLPLLSWKLLASDAPEKIAVRARYRERFRHVFVDEFQDTSPLQAKLIDLLRGKGNLFTVGDRQQSIYAFRYADPALFSRYEAASSKKIILDENYRSRVAVLDFANGLFAGDSPGNVFNQLIAGKKFNSEGRGAVEVLCAFYGENEGFKNLEQAREEEARFLAERLSSLVRSSELLIEDGTPHGRPIRWGDIAILFRSAKKAPVYERALARLEIPFYSVRSKGFFEKPEVKDLVSFLALLDHPDDDVSLAAVLRSPLAGVSDDGLYCLASAAKKDDPRHRPLARAFDAIDAVKGLSLTDSLRAKAFGEFLESTRAEKNQFTVSHILEKALRWSHYESIILAGSGGSQRIANVRKFVDIARSLEEKTPLDAAEFVRYARGMADRDEAESEARIETEGSDAVFLSSIHAAKGLEFPCVALVNLGGRKNFKYSSLVASSVESGLGWSQSDPFEEDSWQDRAYGDAVSAFKQKLDEEEDRLLYVAVTRAKEWLLLCGSAPRATGSPPKSATWMGRILDYTGWDVSSPVEGVNSSHAVSETTPPPASAEVEAILQRLRLPERTYNVALDLTVSDLLARTRQKSRETRSEEPESIDPEDLERSPRNEYGTVYHRLMEMMTRDPARGLINEKFVRQILSPLTAAEKEEAYQSAMAFWKTPIGLSVKKSPARYPELPFIFKTPHGILKGQIDLVYKDGGEWVILDYKTNRVTAAEKEKTASDYEFQLALYALVFKNIFGEAPGRGVLYFSVLNQTHEFFYKEDSFKAFEDRLSDSFREVTTELKDLDF